MLIAVLNAGDRPFRGRDHGDLDKAQHLCRQAGDQSSVAADGGGFGANHADGTSSTFIQQALDWIAKERRKALRQTS